MNLGEIKAIVVDALGGTVLSAPMLRTFINASSKMLDRMADFPHDQGRLTFTIGAGDFFLVFPIRIRLIHGVWIRTSLLSSASDRLEKRDLIELRGLYPAPSDPSFRNKPTDYAHTTSIMASYGTPTVDELVLPAEDVPVTTEDPYDYKGLVLGPTSDGTYYIDVLGTAYSNVLVADTDSNFWSTHQPLTLMNATLYKIEGFLRNFSSAKDYLAAAQSDINGINFDSFENELQDRPNRMGDIF